MKTQEDEMGSEMGFEMSLEVGRPATSRSSKSKTTGTGQRKWPPTSMVSVIWLLLLADFSAQLADSLRFTSIQMPALVQRGSNFWLACQYELQAAGGGESGESPPEAEQLYSVKWYKNNEEFYRIIFGSATTAGLQQYFTQPGVNVLMSSSNATHVRLLNASLESEGSFACEISTQNLSTIRFEKEIKVYVLPGSGLSLVGLRSFYALGEQVELQCSSDFSRPAGALAWFINGRRVQQITTNNRLQAAASVSSEASSKEPKLSRSRLTLKLKLTSELMAGLASPARPRTSDGNNISQQQQRNQSKSARVASADFAPAAAVQIQTGRLLELMRLECRYKLAEVSDVTFAELKIATPTGSGGGGNRRSRRPERAASPPSEWPRRRLSAQTESKRRPSRSAVSKTLANQIQQRRRLAERDDLLEQMAGSSREVACGSGSLALQREDPVLLGVGEALELEAREDNNRDGQQDGRAGREGDPPEDWLELAPNSIVGVNCSTLGALAGDWQRGSAGLRQWRRTASEARPDEPAMNYCDDSEARRRLLISGKYQSDTAETAAAANQRRRKQPSAGHNNNRRSNHHIAYVSLGEPRSSDGSLDDNASGRQARKFAQGDKLSLPADSSSAAKSLDQLHDNTNSGMQLRPGSAWLAPPLLEWFINNQEAPKSSASYSPELPLVSVSNRSLRNQRLQMAPPSDDAPDESDQALELPSIDYREYFANFESRPIDQYLVLRLALEKRHFMTPDSLLRLRCTSTQAQVLAVDSLSVSLFLLPTNVNPLDLVQEQNASDGRRAGDSPSKWLQRQASIKSKHIHKQSLASQSPTQQDHANSGSKQIPSLWSFAQLRLVLTCWLLLVICCANLRHSN